MEKEFIELINQNRGLIFKVCNLYCDDEENRKDLFQEVVLQLWRSFSAFRKECATSTWIYRVALNTAISNFRKESKKPSKQPLGLSEFEIPDIPAGNDDRENKSMLKLAIEKLTEIEKAIIMLYLDEKSYEEISEIVGISISNVGVRLNRIKNKLSNLIKTTQI
ncbi:MAG TPA: sigma-70 family RNA polymerase sigma factor [Chitinophagaceae bacterium]|nr:sigma-70 family RNA polymerase sigma factor [Chitinophagaceae bacterium]